MSAETMEWLNTNVLVGMTEKYGSAWHYVENEQGSESNHYPGAIPLEDVRRRLFYWTPVEGKLITTYTDAEGNSKQITDPARKAIIRPAEYAETDKGKVILPNTNEIFGIFKNGYQIHDYNEWLYDTIATLLDDDELIISSAGLLQKGAQAWLQIETPESITTPEGINFRPHILGATSLNGTLATTFGKAIVNTVCDNTMSAALGSMGDQKIKIKHTRYSNVRIQDARDALAIVHDIGDAFAAQVAELCNVTVTDDDWSKFLDEINPIPEDEGRGRTVALNKRDILTGMWESDSRVAPWKETAWGVVQAINTYSSWENSVHGEDENPNARQERNMTRAVKGGVDTLDKETLEILNGVLTTA